jgi:hypothetical protein
MDLEQGILPNMLSLMVNHILNLLDNQKTVLGGFLDISKAFDCVNYQILLNKLNYYGFRGLIHSWLSDYLNHRYQYVSLNNHNSNITKISIGVLQGSILGPLLFLIYVNDLPLASSSSKFVLFADDTSVIFSGNSIKLAYNNANRELANILLWFRVNRLILNVTKSNSMHFELISNTNAANHYDIILSNTILYHVPCVKYLGVYIDCNLNWKVHTSHVLTKISQGCNIIRCSYYYTPKSVLKLIYHASVYPYLTYCIECWGNAAQICLKPILVKQKNVLRLMGGYNCLESGYYVAHMLKLLLLPEYYELYIYLLMHSVSNANCPINVAASFVKADHIHSTRQVKNNFYVPQIRTAAYRNSICVNSIFLWNSLELSIKQITSAYLFRTKILMILFNKYKNSL